MQGEVAYLRKHSLAKYPPSPLTCNLTNNSDAAYLSTNLKLLNPREIRGRWKHSQNSRGGVIATILYAQHEDIRPGRYEPGGRLGGGHGGDGTRTMGMDGSNGSEALCVSSSLEERANECPRHCSVVVRAEREEVGRSGEAG
jgi:hypothetical protein